MLDRLSGTGRAAVFYALALGLAVIIALAGSSLGEMSPLATMFTPTIATVAMMFLLTGEGRAGGAWSSLGLSRAGLSGWPLAIIAPPVLLGVAYALLWATSYADYRPLGFSGGIVIGFVLGIVAALGEEIGWRGYMLPELMAVGALPAMLIVGFCHGLWHMPIIFLTPFYHADGNLLVVVPLFLVTLTLAGVFFGYLRIVTGSVWPVAIAHGVHNNVWSILSERTTGPSPDMIEYLGGESGVFEIAGLAVLAVVLIYLFRRRPVAHMP